MPNVASLPAAPEGSRWRYAEVATNHGDVSLGERPLLEWEATEAGVSGARKHYGDEGVANSLNGTSLLVSYQGICRRLAIAGKAPEKNLSDDDIDQSIAKAILEFRPGKRAEATPASAAARAAKTLTEGMSEKGAEGVKSLLERIKAKMAAGEISEEDLATIEL